MSAPTAINQLKALSPLLPCQADKLPARFKRGPFTLRALEMNEGWISWKTKTGWGLTAAGKAALSVTQSAHCAGCGHAWRWRASVDHAGLTCPVCGNALVRPIPRGAKRWTCRLTDRGLRYGKADQ